MTEQGITEDRLFESVLRRLSASAFTCVVRCGVRDIDTFLELDIAEFTETKPSTIQELSSAQQWARGQLYGTSFADTVTISTNQPVQDNDPRKPAEEAEDTELLQSVINGLSTRSQHALAYGQVMTYSRFMDLDADTMADWPNTGTKTIVEILNVQNRLDDLASKCREQGMVLNADSIRDLLKQLTRVPCEQIEHPLATRRPTLVTQVEHGVDEPEPWSVLKMTMLDLLPLDDRSLDALWTATEDELLGNVVSLPKADWAELSAGAVYRDDWFDTVLPLTLGYLAELGVSAQALDKLATSLAIRAGSSRDTISSGLRDAASDQPIVSETEIDLIRNFRLDSFDVPEKLLQQLASQRPVTWCDLTSLTERGIIDASSAYFDALSTILAVWRIRLVAQQATARMSGLPMECFANFESMIQAYINLVAKRSRDRTVLEGRLGLLQNRKWTLDELGQLLGLTRERVRQIEKKMLKALKLPAKKRQLARFWLALDETLRIAGGVCTIAEVAEQIAAKLEWNTKPSNAQVVSLLQLLDDVIVDKRARLVRSPHDKCYTCEIIVSVLEDMFAEDRSERPLSSVIAELLSACAQVEECADRSTKLSLSEGFVRFLTQRTDGILTEDGVVYCRSTWGSRRGSRVQLVESILWSAGRPMHFGEVFEEAKRLLPDDLRVTEHNVYSWIGNSSNLLLWDRGTYIHREQVSIPWELIGKVESWLEDKLAGGVPFVSVAGAYSAFGAELAEAGIVSESALYSCLRESGKETLGCPRYPYVVLSGFVSERLPVGIALEQYVLDAGGLVTFQEVKTYAVEDLCIAEQMFAIHIYNAPNLIRAGKGNFIHLENLKLDRARVETILGYVRRLLSSEGHVSVEKVYLDKQISCKTMGIDSPEMLYAVLQTHLDAGMLLPGYPQIASTDYRVASGGIRGVLDEVADYIALRESPCSFDELEQHFVEDLGYNVGTVYNVIIRDYIVRYSRGSVVHLDTLEWTDEKQQAIEDQAGTAIKQARDAGRCYGLIDRLLEYGRLPRIGNEVVWTQTLLAELLSRGGHFRILGSARNAFVALPNEVGIETFEDLVCVLLRTKYEGALELEVFEQDMRDACIIQKRVTPGMLGDQRKVTISGHLIMLRELFDHA